MRIRDINKEQLVREQAIRLLVSEGLEGFSMNKLAKACGISVATLYIYYQGKDDLITRIATEELTLMNEAMLRDFDLTRSFEEGLRKQWENRAGYILSHPLSSRFMEQLRNSTYQDKVFGAPLQAFRTAMETFVKKAVANKEIAPMPVEVFWSVAYGPLYTLLRFHQQGQSITGRSFTFQSSTLWQAFDLVIRALKK